jgi:hypothetical protein
VKYDDGVVRSFQSQLIFSKMTDPGDSGAVIVRQSDTTVTGLNFAGNDTETIANPIYLAGWRRQGSIRFDGGAEIPMFAGNSLPAALPPPGAQEQLGPASDQFAMPQRSVITPSGLRALDPPNLSAGLLFLGSSTKVIPRSGQGNPYYAGPPPPPPIRPGVQVQEVVASVTPTAQGWQYQTVFFFG